MAEDGNVFSKHESLVKMYGELCNNMEKQLKELGYKFPMDGNFKLEPFFYHTLEYFLSYIVKDDEYVNDKQVEYWRIYVRNLAPEYANAETMISEGDKANKSENYFDSFGFWVALEWIVLYDAIRYINLSPKRRLANGWSPENCNNYIRLFQDIGIEFLEYATERTSKQIENLCTYLYNIRLYVDRRINEDFEVQLNEL